MTITRVDFDPDRKRIEDIFEGSLQLVIPRYQRTYSWPKDKVEEFFEDFVEESPRAEDNLAFLGTIIFSLGDKGQLEVIDGQQRLVTITIFFAALRDLLQKVIGTEEAKHAAMQLQNKIKINSSFGSSYSTSDANQYKLMVGAEIESIFQLLIYNPCKDLTKVKAKNGAERKVLDAYNLFYRKVKEKFDIPSLKSSDKIKLVDRLLAKINSIDYIDIRVTNDDVAYNLFESHNAKGVALAKTDLIKNYYFGRIKGPPGEQNKKMDAWDNLFKELDEKTSNMLPDRFFNYMLQSYEGNFSSSNLYRRIKPYMAHPDKFYKTLKTNVDSMISLKTANTGDIVMDRSLAAINTKLNVNQCFILLLCLHRNRSKLSPKYLRKLVLMIENFTYLYSGVVKLPTNALEKLYSKYAHNLEKELSNFDSTMDNIEKEKISGRLYSKLSQELKAMKPAFNIFLESFSELTYDVASNRAIIRYSFEKIEYFYSDGMVELGSTFTLDHIIPQKDVRNKGRQFQTIGNLVPLSPSSNSIKGAKIADRIMYEKNSNFYSTKSLIEQLEKGKSFNSESIGDRINTLADYMYNKVCSV